MADTASRPPPSRARGSARGGRGGSRGGFRSGRDRHTNGDYTKDNAASDDFTDQGEIGEMKKQYSSQLSTLRELFPDWTDVDLVFALQETGGDLQSAVERISEGHVSQFSDVKHHKERVKPKAKDYGGGAPEAPHAGGAGRGRGRSDRGRGGFRGARGGHTSSNGIRTASGAASTPTGDAQEWGEEGSKAGEAEATSQWGKVVTAKATPAAASEGAKKSLLPEGPPKKTWAQMFAKPAAAPIPSKAGAPSGPSAESSIPPTEAIGTEASTADQDEAPNPTISDEVSTTGSFEMVEPPESAIDESVVDIAPPREQLTQENVEHLPDASHPPPTGTQASTLDSASRGPDSATPSVVAQASQPAPIGRPGMGGFATTAFKATNAAGSRSASFQRRLLDQQESVVMPGSHNTVERTALQFGSMGLNGDPDSPDVDEEREEAETRAQPPQHSPPSQPRASLPPVPRQVAAPAEAQQEAAAQTKPAPGLPSVPQQQLSQSSPSGQLASQMLSQQGAQGNQAYGQFGRYGQDASAAAQKNYNDPFGQQQPQQSSFDNYVNQAQAPVQSQQQPSQLGGYSSAANDYSSYYTADQRSAYQNYYGGGYGPQSTSQQDAGASQPRTGSAFGAAGGAAGDSGYTAAQGQQSQSRYGEAQASGNNTPNPSAGGQQQSGAPSQHTQQPHSQNQQHGGYQYGGGNYGGHYNRMDPYYAAYMNQQFGYGAQQGGYGNSFGGKGGMYGQPHHAYGMSPGSGYDQHALSQASGGSFGQTSLQGRESGFSSGLGSGLGSEYTRSGSAQPSQNQQSSTTSGFSGMHDVFGRSGSSYPSQGQQYSQQTSGSQGEDSLKPFGDNKAAGGPPPSAINQPGRPGSATNTANQSSSLPQSQSQSQQQGFSGGYPSNYSQMQSNQGSQYGNLGGLGGHQGGQSHQSGYGGNYGAGFGGSYGSYGGRGGWGGNYGH